MLEKSGVLANGVMIEVLMKVIRKMMQHSGRSLIVEQLIINFLQAVQVDDVIPLNHSLFGEPDVRLWLILACI